MSDGVHEATKDDEIREEPNDAYWRGYRKGEEDARIKYENKIMELENNFKKLISYLEAGSIYCKEANNILSLASKLKERR